MAKPTVGLRFRSFAIPDRAIPESDAASSFARELAAELDEGRAVAIHCRMGIGRSSLIAAAVLVARGTKPENALQRISAARGLAVPDTEAQRRWIFALT